jgi:hypothetical protein
MIRGVCPWHVSLTPKWSAMAIYKLSSSSSSIIKEIKKKLSDTKTESGSKKKKKYYLTKERSDTPVENSFDRLRCDQLVPKSKSFSYEEVKNSLQAPPS